jgi:hypothetical protein
MQSYFNSDDVLFVKWPEDTWLQNRLMYLRGQVAGKIASDEGSNYLPDNKRCVCGGRVQAGMCTDSGEQAK